MKKLLILLITTLFFASCKTKSNIITSKEVAIKKGIYEYDAKKNLAIAKKSELKAKKELEKKELDLAKSLKKKEALAKKLEKDNNSGINSVRLSIVEKAKEFIGTPYRYGGTTTNGLDCSGLTCNSYKKAEIELPRRSIDQSKEGIKIKKSKAKPGDLIFFKTSRRNVINHVGIVTENNNGEISFIHASSSSGVVISSLLESYYKDTFAKIKRIIE
jgi:murein DD-endopeptidase / murein LD-carboxypeptidase